MIRKIIILTVISCMSLGLYALDLKGLTKKKDKAPEIDVVSWVGQESSDLPAQVDGIKVFRPNKTNDDGQPIITGVLPLKAGDRSQAFIAAYVCAGDDLDEDTDAIDAVDYDKKTFSIYREIREGEYKDAVVYRFVTDYDFTGGKMSFTIRDISIEYKEKGILPRKVNIGKLKPANNERHRELIEGVSLACSRVLDGMTKSVARTTVQPVNHWTEIKSGKVVKGMNETEVRCVGGKPRSVSKSGVGTQWMYSNDFIVVFNGGVVTNVMQ